MASQWDARMIRSMRPLAWWMGVGISILGLVVFLGWAFDVVALKTLLLGPATLKVNTALAFFLAGISLMLNARTPANSGIRPFAQSCGAAVALIGLMTVLEYTFNWNLHVDQLLFRDPAPLLPGYVPGRMSLESACNLLLDGLALAFIDVETRQQRPAQWLALIASVPSGLALAGYAFELQSLYAVPSYGRMALHTAIAFTALSVGILLARPDAGLMKILSSDDAGGAMARRLVPVAVIVPFILRWVSLRANEAGIYSAPFARPLETILLTVVLVVLIYGNARRLEDSDRQRKLAEDSLREAHHDLQRKVAEQTTELRATSAQYRQLVEQVPAITYIAEPGAAGRWHYVSPQIEKVLGFTPQEWMTNPHLWFQQVHVEDRERVLAQDQRNRHHGDRYQIEYRIWTKDNQEVWLRDDIQVWLSESGQPLFHGLLLDVTESKRADEILRKSEQQLSLIFNNATDMMALFSVEGDNQIRLVSINRRYLEVIRDAGFDIASSGLIGRTIEELMSQVFKFDVADVEKTVGRYLQAVRSCQSLRYEEVHDTPRGRYFGQTVLSPVLGPDGRCTFVLFSSQDITQAREAEEALREGEKRLRTLTEASFEGLVFSEHGVMVDVNDQLANMLGYARWEMIGTPVLNYVAPESRDKVTRALQSGFASAYEHLALRKDGSTFPVEVCARMMDLGDRKMRVTAVRDITERRQAETAIKEAEERFEKAFHASPEGMVISTLQEGRFVEVNAAFERMLEYDKNELMGRVVNSVGLWVDPERRAVLAERLRQGEPVREEEVQYRTKSGRILDAQTTANLLEVGGETCVLAIVRDMTQQHALERQLQQAQKMEAVGRLAGGVAHDFNNILMIISSAAQMMQNRKRATEQLDRYLDQIQAAADKAATLTRQLLAFSRQQVLRPTVLNLNSVVTELWQILPRLLGEDIETELRLADDLSTVSADRGQIEQVIMNLAVNARDAMPEGGKLIVETADVELDTATSTQHGSEVAPGRYVMLAVSDTGMGMDTETQSKIFEPFFTTKAFGKGTGLGLATVYGIVRQSSGYVWVYSEVRRGTTFKVYLPRGEAKPVVAAATELEKVASSGAETILLVEDEAALREVTCEYLRSKGYVVLEAGNRSQAIRLCQNHEGPIHLLLTDVVVPGGGGADTAKAVLAARPNLRVIYMSGYADRLVSGELQGQETNFLQKPFSLEVLSRKIRSVLNGVG